MLCEKTPAGARRAWNLSQHFPFCKSSFVIYAHNCDSEQKAKNLCKIMKTKKKKSLIELSKDAFLIPNQEAFFNDYPVYLRNVPYRC